MASSESWAKPDLLIIGSGISGCAAALRAAELGLSVTLLCASTDPLNSNSYWAQGGIIYKATDDKPELLEQDIQSAGAGMSDVRAAHKLAVEGPERVDQFLLQGASAVEFDRASDGSLLLTLEGSHSKSRIIHWRDHTGKAIMEAMITAVKSNPRITLKPGAVALDLLLSHSTSTSHGPAVPGSTDAPQASSSCGSCGFLPYHVSPSPAEYDDTTDDSSTDGSLSHVFRPHSVTGALVLDPEAAGEGKRLVPVRAAGGVVLATGGLGEVFAHTSNPPSARGDGLAMALRAGAQAANLEFVQFHPTTLLVPGERRFLLTEALRGEGAILRSPVSKEPFARRYDPKRGELAPRDVVARMINQEMHATGSDHVLLDISHKDPEWIKTRFPAIYKHCLDRGFDMTKQPLPVVPAAHYSCGGVAVDLDGRTSLPGLWAVGEVACTGLHGANRLASTSLLEGLVWGATAVEQAAVEQAGAAQATEGPGDQGELLVPLPGGAAYSGGSPPLVPLEVVMEAKGAEERASFFPFAASSEEPSTDEDEDKSQDDLQAADLVVEGRLHGQFRTLMHPPQEAPLNPTALEKEADLLWARMKKVMWEKVGLVRRPAEVQQAAAEIALIQRAADHLYSQHVVAEHTATVDSRVWEKLAGLRNAALTALTIARAAACNHTSAGAHHVVAGEGVEGVGSMM